LFFGGVSLGRGVGERGREKGRRGSDGHVFWNCSSFALKFQIICSPVQNFWRNYERSDSSASSGYRELVKRKCALLFK